MLPHAHIIFGAAFALLASLLPSISFVDAAIIFLASVLIDIDHYAVYFLRKKDFSLKRAYTYFVKLEHESKKKKAVCPLSLLHTVEFLFTLLILSFFDKTVFLIFLGFLFHSLLDIAEMAVKKRIYSRNFSLISYIKNRKRPNYI